MKVEKLNEEKVFEPLKIELTIESADELNELCRCLGYAKSKLTSVLFDFLEQNGAINE